MNKDTEYEIVDTNEGRVKLLPVEMGMAKLKVTLNNILCEDPDTRFFAFYHSTREHVEEVSGARVCSTKVTREGLPESEYHFEVRVPLDGTLIYVNAIGLHHAYYTSVNSITLSPLVPAIANLVATLEVNCEPVKHPIQSMLTQMKKTWRMAVQSFQLVKTNV